MGSSRAARVRAVVVALFACAVAAATCLANAVPAGASTASDQAQITQLQHQLANEGQQVEQLVGRLNSAQARVNALQAQIEQQQKVVDAAHARVAATMRVAKRAAVLAYITKGSADSPGMELFSDTTSITSLLTQNHYLEATDSKLDGTVRALELQQAQLEDAQASLRTQRDVAAASARTLRDARNSANAAMAADQATLRRAQGNLAKAIAAQAAENAEHEEARERAEAAKQHAHASTTAPRAIGAGPTGGSSGAAGPPQVSAPAPPLLHVPTTGYANPLRSIAALNPERIDAGVDYSGFGPIYAIGNGVVLNTDGNGWPGGTFIAYRLTDGPASGLVVYSAEDILPSVSVGDHVTPNTVIGQMYEGPSGIEIGWADPVAIPNALARSTGQFNGSNSSAYGYNFSQLLQSLGAPPGILENNPPTGTLPPNWPRW